MSKRHFWKKNPNKIPKIPSGKKIEVTDVVIDAYDVINHRSWVTSSRSENEILDFFSREGAPGYSRFARDRG